jgi:ribonuclease E
MLINAEEPEEYRLAIVSGKKLEEFYVETTTRENTRGNIYKGVVVNIQPSLQAAFVDFGTEKAFKTPCGLARNSWFKW